MDSKQEAKVSMYLKVQQYLANRLAALVALFSIISDYKTDLDDFLTAIFEADALATADTTGYSEAKEQKRDEVTTLAVRVSGGGAAYYKGQGDSGKQNEIFFNLSEFTHAKDTVVYTYAMQVHRLANEAGVALAPHGITTTDIDNLNLKAQQYLAIVQLPQGKRSEKFAQGKKVDTLLKETDDLLNETLDPQMRVLKGTADNELLVEYESNRLIDDNPSGGEDLTGYNVETYNIPPSGSIIVALEPGSLSPDLELYFRAIVGNVIVCTTDLPASPCVTGFELLEGVSFKDTASELGIDLTKTHIQVTNPALSAASVRVGVKDGE